ncbi:MAG TPA: helix-turn-helix domain-containing protein [Firmicutes bacterium]|nr:helix-turn-helix domain-containing protein [Bacillota bacterium]
MKLGEKIRSLRRKNGLSQQELAEKLYVSRQAVSRWEMGAAQPEAANVWQLSRLFGVTADYLLNDDYQSDQDVPAVKRTEATASRRERRVVAICVAAFGLLGNFLFYLLSCFIEVWTPIISYEDGEKIYHWVGNHTGYSYRYFLREHHLTLVAAALWLMFAAGLAWIILDALRAKAAGGKVRRKAKSRRRGAAKTPAGSKFGDAGGSRPDTSDDNLPE